MSLNKTVTGCLRPLNDLDERALVFQNRLGDIFGNVTFQHVAVAPPLELFQRVLENDSERAGGQSRQNSGGIIGSDQSLKCVNATWQPTKKARPSRRRAGDLSAAPAECRRQMTSASAIAPSASQKSVSGGSFRQPRRHATAAAMHLRLDFRSGHFAKRRGVDVMKNFRHRADDDDFVARWKVRP